MVYDLIRFWFSPIVNTFLYPTNPIALSIVTGAVGILTLVFAISPSTLGFVNFNGRTVLRRCWTSLCRFYLDINRLIQYSVWSAPFGIVSFAISFTYCYNTMGGFFLKYLQGQPSRSNQQITLELNASATAVGSRMAHPVIVYDFNYGSSQLDSQLCDRVNYITPACPNMIYENVLYTKAAVFQAAGHPYYALDAAKFYGHYVRKFRLMAGVAHEFIAVSYMFLMNALQWFFTYPSVQVAPHYVKILTNLCLGFNSFTPETTDNYLCLRNGRLFWFYVKVSTGLCLLVQQLIFQQSLLAIFYGSSTSIPVLYFYAPIVLSTKILSLLLLYYITPQWYLYAQTWIRVIFGFALAVLVHCFVDYNVPWRVMVFLDWLNVNPYPRLKFLSYTDITHIKAANATYYQAIKTTRDLIMSPTSGQFQY